MKYTYKNKKIEKQKIRIFPILMMSIFFIGAFWDNNVTAQTIEIGSQTWCTKNLEVSTYRNGDAIPEVQDYHVWDTLTTGAWCYYENNSENGITYGKLYNWFAVNDKRGLAPKGFHIPNDAEWKSLIDFLGGENAAGTKMKSSTGWENYGSGTNQSGFTGLPGGYRSTKNGRFGFEHVRNFSKWWSSEGKFCSMSYYNGNAFLDNNKKEYGLSVRCLAD